MNNITGNNPFSLSFATHIFNGVAIKYLNVVPEHFIPAFGVLHCREAFHFKSALQISRTILEFIFFPHPYLWRVHITVNNFPDCKYLAERIPINNRYRPGQWWRAPIIAESVALKPVLKVRIRGDETSLAALRMNTLHTDLPLTSSECIPEKSHEIAI